MKILLIGLGQLGKDLRRVLKAEHDIAGVDIPDIDITDADSIHSVIESHAPELVINAAAYTDVEGAEDNEAPAYAVNERGAQLVARETAARGIPVVHYSTDFVFDGRATEPYTVDATTNPLSVYGTSKLAGDKAVAAENPKHFIVRTAWLYGPGGNNFVEKIIGWTQKNDVVRVVTDEVGSPTHTWDLAAATAGLIKTQAYGSYHGVNGGSCSRFELAQSIVDALGIDVTLEQCVSAEFPTKAERPMYSVLDAAKLNGASGFTMPTWEDALSRYLARRESV